jgi:ABC-type dipeptide/oligopeptide/nickel transport system permease subunit
MRTLKYLVRMLRDFGQFAWQNKAWWIVPVVIILLLLSALIFVGTSVAPFLYPMV